VPPIHCRKGSAYTIVGGLSCTHCSSVGADQASSRLKIAPSHRLVDTAPRASRRAPVRSPRPRWCVVAIDAPTASTLNPIRNMNSTWPALPRPATALSPMRLAINVDTTPLSMCSVCSAKMGQARRSRPGSGAASVPGDWETVVIPSA